MVKYKSLVTDYEGLQANLDTHTSQGWRLFSVTPDTWRKSADPGGSDSAPFDELSTAGKATSEYSASYYLVIFEREEYIGDNDLAATAEESYPRHFYEG